MRRAALLWAGAFVSWEVWRDADGGGRMITPPSAVTLASAASP
jgi:hypothetical protein